MEEPFTDVILNMTERQLKLSKNDGTHSFSITQNKCYNHEAPFDDSQETFIKITSNEHDIHQLRDTYLHMVFDVEFTITRSLTVKNNTVAIVHNSGAPSYLFLGWRNSSEVFRQIEVMNQEFNTGYLQRECGREGFAMGTYKTMEEKKNQKFVHSLYEDVIRHQHGVCGGYYEITSDINNGATLTISNVEVIVPITDIPAFQYMDELPGLLGDIVLKFFVNRNSMVWAQVDPYLTYQAEAKANGVTSELDNKYKYIAYNPKFNQVGNKGVVITNYTTPTQAQDQTHEVSPGEITLRVNSLTCTKCVCDCYGYNVQDDVKTILLDTFRNFYIPCKQVDVVNFTTPIWRSHKVHYIEVEKQKVPVLDEDGKQVYEDDGKTPKTQEKDVEVLKEKDADVPDKITYTSDLTLPLRNVSDILLVFPKNQQDQTVFQNPVLQKLQLRINGKQFPKEPFEDTSGARFTAIQIRAGYNEKYCEIDKEWLDSINRNIYWTGYQFNDSACVIRFQLKRNCPDGREMVYDGIETGTENVNLQLSFVASKETDKELIKNNPQLWLVRDTFWTASAQNGLKYYKYGSAL